MVGKIIRRRVINGKVPFIARGEDRSFMNFYGQKAVSKGYVHVYRFKKFAELMCGLEPNKILRECVIKAGTPYYEDIDTEGLCAKSIWFVSENNSNTKC